MRRISALMLVSAIILTGCGVDRLLSSPSTVTVTDLPSQSTAKLPPNAPTAAYGGLLKKIGESAVFTANGVPILSFTVNEIAVNRCPSTTAPEPPQHGTYIVIDITAQTYSEEIVLDWHHIFMAWYWQVIGPDAYVDTHVDTSNTYTCDDVHPPSTFGLNSKYRFQVVLDSKFDSGQVVFRPAGLSNGWVWDIP